MKLILIGDVHGNSVALNSCIVDALVRANDRK